MKKSVGVSQLIEVEVDEKKFTPEFMAEFRASHYQFHDVEDHIEHLAQLHARGIADNFSDFIEGYGDPKEFGIRFRATDCETSLVDL